MNSFVFVNHKQHGSMLKKFDKRTYGLAAAFELIYPTQDLPVTKKDNSNLLYYYSVDISLYVPKGKKAYILPSYDQPGIIFHQRKLSSGQWNLIQFAIETKIPAGIASVYLRDVINPVLVLNN